MQYFNAPCERGRWGERLACTYLQRQGFRVERQNFRHGRAEIDLIVTQARLLVFVEVKLRRHSSFGMPEAQVSPQQRTRIIQAAEVYLMQCAWPHAIRFDIIALHCRRNQVCLQHFVDAFY